MRTLPSPAFARLPTGGFSLIELMIVVALFALLAMIAVPAYQESVRKSRRAEAYNALAALQQSQERWRGNNPAYTTTLGDLGGQETTASGYYTVSLSAPSEAEGALATGYIATATAVSGTSQASDSCARLSVRMLNGNLSYAGCASCESFTYTETSACWAR